MGVSVKEFAEQGHDNDGRSMHIHFTHTAGPTCNLYLARYEDGRGTELLLADVKDAQQVHGRRPTCRRSLLPRIVTHALALAVIAVVPVGPARHRRGGWADAVLIMNDRVTSAGTFGRSIDSLVEALT